MIFIHSQVDGHLGNRQFCAIMNNDVVSIHSPVLRAQAFSAKFLALVLLGDTVNLCVTF